MPLQRRHPPERANLARAWHEQAANWLAWTRGETPDSYGLFHRDAFLALLPPPGRLTLDVGCGEGRLARDLARLGHRVIGIDASRAMIGAAARSGGAVFAVGDAAALPVAAGAADLALAFMSMQDMDDMPAAMSEMGRALSPAGIAVVAVVHPLNSAGHFDGAAAGADFRISGSYLASRYYEDEAVRNGVTMRFASLHHPLEAYSRAVERAGLLVEAIREPPEPGDSRWSRLPLFLHLRLRKAGQGAPLS